MKTLVISACLVLTAAGCTKKEKETRYTFEIQKVRHSFLASFKHADAAHYSAVNNLRSKSNQFNNVVYQNFFDQLRNAWIASWHSYQLFKPYSYIQGAIDSPVNYDRDKVENFALNLSYLDSTLAQPQSGIVYDEINFPTINSTIVSSLHSSTSGDKAIGYQVAEFLLWGEDNSIPFGGARVLSDFGVNSTGDRRRALLTGSIFNLSSEFSVFYTESFEQSILNASNEDFLRLVFSGLLTFLEEDFAQNAVLKPYNSQNIDDELSRFSENTKIDLMSMIEALELLLYGEGIQELANAYYFIDFIGDVNLEIKSQILDDIENSKQLILAIQGNFDNAISSSSERPKIYNLYTNLVSISTNLRAFAEQINIQL